MGVTFLRMYNVPRHQRNNSNSRSRSVRPSRYISTLPKHPVRPTFLGS